MSTSVTTYMPVVSNGSSTSTTQSYVYSANKQNQFRFDSPNFNEATVWRRNYKLYNEFCTRVHNEQRQTTYNRLIETKYVQYITLQKFDPVYIKLNPVDDKGHKLCLKCDRSRIANKRKQSKAALQQRIKEDRHDNTLHDEFKIVHSMDDPSSILTNTMKPFEEVAVKDEVVKNQQSDDMLHDKFKTERLLDDPSLLLGDTQKPCEQVALKDVVVKKQCIKFRALRSCIKWYTCESDDSSISSDTKIHANSRKRVKARKCAKVKKRENRTKCAKAKKRENRTKCAKAKKHAKAKKNANAKKYRNPAMYACDDSPQNSEQETQCVVTPKQLVRVQPNDREKEISDLNLKNLIDHNSKQVVRKRSYTYINTSVKRCKAKAAKSARLELDSKEKVHHRNQHKSNLK